MHSTRRTFLIATGAAGAAGLLPTIAQARNLPETTPIARVRMEVASRVEFLNPIAREDVLSPMKTVDNIVRALDVLSRSYPIIVTALRSDHHVDGNLGPHGYNPRGLPGWAAGFVPKSNPYLQDAAHTTKLIADLIANNYYVARVGAPAAYTASAGLQQKAQAAGVAFFTEEGTAPHIAIFTREDAVLAQLPKNR